MVKLAPGSETLIHQERYHAEWFLSLNAEQVCGQFTVGLSESGSARLVQDSTNYTQWRLEVTAMHNAASTESESWLGLAPWLRLLVVTSHCTGSLCTLDCIIRVRNSGAGV